MKTQMLISTVAAAMSLSAHAIDLPEVNPMVLQGDVICAGSSTVYPLSERMAERFKDEGFEGNISVDSIGSGAGFERFCTGCETDIANASRPIKDKEIENCANSCSRDPIEIRVGTDALAVCVSKKNTFVKELTMEQLRKIWSAEGKLWSDIDPSWPSEKIQHFSPGTDSGTFDYFAEELFKKIAKATGQDHKKMILDAPGLQLSEDDNVLVQGVSGSPYAIAYFGFAYYVENARKLTALNIDGVEPKAENVDNGSYPLARPLYMYCSAEIMKAKPQVAAFLNFYLTYVNEEVTDVGYFPAPKAALDAAKQAWLEAMK
jgi:phosphate transport system substrate-binding protein